MSPKRKYKRTNRQVVDVIKEIPWESFMKDFTESRKNFKKELDNLKSFRNRLETLLVNVNSGIENLEYDLEKISDMYILD